LENVGANFADERGEVRWLFRHLKLDLKPGQCTGVVGRNGVGKTTLLRICMGDLAPSEGTVKIGRQVKFNYVDQARMQLDPNKNVMEQVADGGETVLFGEERMSARGYLRRFLFADDRAMEPITKLSGGERARLMLARVLKKGGNMLVLDEPTNDLDLPSLRMLEEALVSFEGSALVVSHDRYFLDRICDQIVAFEDGGVFIQPGNYSYYIEKKKERAAAASAREQRWSPAPAKAAKVEPVIEATKSSRPRKLSFKEQRELEGMEAAILAAETRVQKLEATLNDSNFYATRAAEAPKLIADLEAAKAEVARLYARWEELTAVSK
jgi:ABC transport system ATP-binding/permease protein